MKDNLLQSFMNKGIVGHEFWEQKIACQKEKFSI